MELGTVILLILWGALASSVILRLRRRGGTDFQPPIAPDKHRLVGSAALYLATPAAVLASQCVQIGLLERAGAGYTFTSWIYWGVVEPARPDAIGPLARAAVAAAGPTTLLSVAAIAFTWTRLRPTGAAHNLARLEHFGGGLGARQHAGRAVDQAGQVLRWGRKRGELAH